MGTALNRQRPGEAGNPGQGHEILPRDYIQNPFFSRIELTAVSVYGGLFVINLDLRHLVSLQGVYRIHRIVTEYKDAVDVGPRHLYAVHGHAVVRHGKTRKLLEDVLQPVAGKTADGMGVEYCRVIELLHQLGRWNFLLDNSDYSCQGICLPGGMDVRPAAKQKHHRHE